MSGNICDLSRISKLGGGIPGAQPLGGLLGGGAGSTGGSGMEGGSTRGRNREELRTGFGRFYCSKNNKNNEEWNLWFGTFNPSVSLIKNNNKVININENILNSMLKVGPDEICSADDTCDGLGCNGSLVLGGQNKLPWIGSATNGVSPTPSTFLSRKILGNYYKIFDEKLLSYLTDRTGASPPKGGWGGCTGMEGSINPAEQQYQKQTQEFYTNQYGRVINLFTYGDAEGCCCRIAGNGNISLVIFSENSLNYCVGTGANGNTCDFCIPHSMLPGLDTIGMYACIGTYDQHTGITQDLLTKIFIKSQYTYTKGCSRGGDFPRPPSGNIFTTPCGVGLSQSTYGFKSPTQFMNIITISDPAKSSFPITPFRQAYNAGDLNGTVCERILPGLYGPNPLNNNLGPVSSLIKFEHSRGIKNGGGSQYTGNPRFVYDGSDYVRFKRLVAKNKTYNDSSFGGSNNGSYVPLMRVR